MHRHRLQVGDLALELEQRRRRDDDISRVAGARAGLPGRQAQSIDDLVQALSDCLVLDIDAEHLVAGVALAVGGAVANGDGAGHRGEPGGEEDGELHCW